MKVHTGGILTGALLAAVLGAGCANNGALSTSSVATEEKTAIAAPKVDPVCASLASQIDGLRKDASLEKLEKASTGKSANVQVKRTTLAKQAELNKANADFQTKCGPPLARPQTAQITPAAATTAQAAAPAAAAAAPAAAAMAPTKAN